MNSIKHLDFIQFTQYLPGLGELFVIRVAGNIANSSSIASIEYAVAHCHSKMIIVMGHESCGAVTAALDNVSGSEHIDHLVSQIAPAIHPDDSVNNLTEVIMRNASHSAQQLAGQSEIIRDAVDSGKVQFELNE